MDTPVVVDSVRSLMEVIRSLVKMVWQDMRVEQTSKVIVVNESSHVVAEDRSTQTIASNRSSQANPYKYHPAEW
ncbi:MAG: hypothetical protein P0111_07905 [Nitrospira sp.]|nr:hypothetical protein [Nitrospira sp.]